MKVVPNWVSPLRCRMCFTVSFASWHKLRHSLTSSSLADRHTYLTWLHLKNRCPPSSIALSHIRQWSSTFTPHLFRLIQNAKELCTDLHIKCLSWSRPSIFISWTISPLCLAYTMNSMSPSHFCCCIVGHHKRPCMPTWLKISLWDHSAMLKRPPSLGDGLEQWGSWLYIHSRICCG